MCGFNEALHEDAFSGSSNKGASWIERSTTPQQFRILEAEGTREDDTGSIARDFKVQILLLVFGF